MPEPVPIADAADPRLADYRDLTDTALRTRIEPEGGLFIAEGELVVRRAVAAGHRLRSLLVAENRLAALEDLLALVAGTGTTVYAAPLPMLRELTGFHVHRGVLGAVHRPAENSFRDLIDGTDGPSRLCVLEELSNPTNLGAVFRSAAALGIDAVLLAPTCGDPLYRRAVRVSMGEVLALPYARLPDWPADLQVLRERGFRLLALTPEPSATALDRLALEEDRVAVLLGAEGPGLSAAALTAADERVRIPMAGEVDSLNVAAAAAVTFWELGRHR